jgi:hypothetical protein
MKGPCSRHGHEQRLNNENKEIKDPTVPVPQQARKRPVGQDQGHHERDHCQDDGQKVRIRQVPLDEVHEKLVDAAYPYFFVRSILGSHLRIVAGHS